MLTALNHRKLARVTVNTPTIAKVLDAIHTALTAVVYYDGATRTPGSGSAWTFSKSGSPTNIAYGTPPTDAIDHRAYFAGETGAPTPNMRAPDTFTASELLVGHTKNAGAFQAWDHATQVFTSGDDFEYWLTGLAGAAGTNILLDLYESQETLWLSYATDAGDFGLVLVGALWDPGSADAADAESDGRVYGQGVSGGALNANWVGAAFTAGVGYIFGSSPTDSQGHSGSFVPGAGTIVVHQGSQQFQGGHPTVTTGVGRSGRNIAFGSPWANVSTTVVWVGSFRQVRYCRNVTNGAVFRDGSTDVGYAVGLEPSGNGQALILLA